MNKISSMIIIPIILFFVYGLTTSAGIKPVLYNLFYYYIFFASGALFYYFWLKHKKLKNKNIPLVYYIVTTTVLIWVGITGWFFSPFFYLVYILAIALAFIFSIETTILYVVTLSFLYLYFFGKIDIYLDTLMILSFVVIIPVIYYLERQYLALKQSQKQILILQETDDKKGEVVKNILHNKVDKFATELRQPINDIRQIALFTGKINNKKEIEKNLKKVAGLGDTILTSIDRFEKQTTGRQIINKSKLTTK